MGWSCRRPGCHHPAAVAITFDAVTCQVWVDRLFADATQLLCELHAERLSPPRGWVVVDRRDGQTSIVSPRAPRVAATPRSPRSQRQWGQLDAPRLEFLGPDPLPAPEPVVEPAPEPEPAPAASTPEPNLEPVSVDDLAALLSPKGGLLGRAFSSTGDQRSALTTPGPVRD
jgi:hypothetical protein